MHAQRKSLRRGSTLVMVALISAGVALVIGVLLRFALTEARINRASILRIEAKNAAEAALEYGAAELAVRFQGNRNFNSTTLVSSPISAHTTRLPSLYVADADRPTSVTPSTVLLYVSNTSTGVTRRIDARDPNNAFDPLRGQTVSSRFVRLLSTATARAAGQRDAVAYATQSLEVRDSQLFNYAIFYNLRMEFHPAPAMEVWGPVHSNESFYLTGGNTVDYFDTVTTAGRMIAAGFSTTGRPNGRSISFTTGVDGNGDNRPDLISISGQILPVSTGGTVTTYVDSDLASRATGQTFADRASQIWRGNAQDASLGVERQNPPGVLNPNDARKLIEPPDVSTSANASIESQKFSRQAGLYILVDRNGTAPRVTLFSSADDALAFKASSNRASWIAGNPSKVIVPPVDMIDTDRRLRDNREAKTVNVVDIDLGKMRAGLRTAAATPAAQKFRVNGADWNYQARWNGAVYVEVENPGAGFTTTSDIAAASGTAPANVHGAGTGTGTATAVRLLNGSQLPTLAPNSSNPNRDRGLSLATNAPVYIAGHFNANGSFGSGASTDGSERSPDPSYQNGTPTNFDDDTEVPALVAADAINILSANWVNSSGVPVGDGRESNLGASGRSAVNTEVSAVLMGGIVETPSNGNGYSGGVENYPRFHEDWAGDTLRYRGSIVALFTSAYGTGTWGKSNVYGAPTRKWGFHDFLKSGEYPPFTPTLRTFRRIDYRDIGRAEFDELLANTSVGFRLMAPPSP